MFHMMLKECWRLLKKILNKNEINFLFIDDQFNDNNFKLGKLGTVDSRHKNCTTFCITQNIHNDMKNFVHFRRQVRYFIIFTERGDRSILTFLRNAFPETAVGLKYRDLPATRWLLCDRKLNKFYNDQLNEISI